MDKRVKIGFASRWSPFDKGSWSGTVHYTYEQVSKRYETEVFQFHWNWLLRERLTSQKSLNKRLFKKQTSVEFLNAYAKYFSRRLSAELKKRPVDCLFVPASSQLIAYVETDVPIIYMTDATFFQLQGYYPGFSGLAHYNIREGTSLDRAAFHKAAHCMLASEWCRKSVIDDYHVAPGKLTVAPCGANLGEVPEAGSLRFYPNNQCQLLFLGVDWQRKGGELVLRAFRLLRSMGRQVSLYIIGCIPPHDLSNEEFITVIPFLDKNDPKDLSRLRQILSETDILFLPTRAECAGVVFSEASAFAIPSVTTDTGGVRTYVQNGVNGFTLGVNAGAQDYATLIGSLIERPASFEELRRSSRNYYEEKLSWDLWGDRFSQIVEQHTGKY